VRERIAELQKGRPAEECGMERIDYAKSLVAMYQSPPSAASMDNPLCDVVHTKSGPRPVFPSFVLLAIGGCWFFILSSYPGKIGLKPRTFLGAPLHHRQKNCLQKLKGAAPSRKKLSASLHLRPMP
jgi:hypothetical protein